MIAFIALLAALASPSPAPAATAALPTDPEQLARYEWAEFSSGTIDQSHFSTPIPQNAIDQLHQVLPSLGAIKSFTLIKHADTQYGPGYAFKVVCEKGSAVEQFTVKDGKITMIYFSPAQ